MEKMTRRHSRTVVRLLAVVLAFLLFVPLSLRAAGQPNYPVVFTDAAGVRQEVVRPPARVVSLSPAISEIILRIGAGEALAGITFHVRTPAGFAGLERVGGFFAPDIERVAALAPDMVFYAPRQRMRVQAALAGQGQLVELAPDSIAGALAAIRLLGRIFDRRAEAERVAAAEERLLDLIARKVERVPPEKRPRVMRIMGRRRLMAPGDDSFQNDFIRAAGGTPPVWGKKGGVVAVSQEEWRRFDPQVVYGCGGDKALLDLLRSPGWDEVEAVRRNRILFFPCERTCRAASHVGLFVAWLSAGLFPQAFADPDNLVLPEQVVASRPVRIGLPYVKDAQIVESDIRDFRNKTLLVRFTRPMRVLSTLEGERHGVQVAGNHFFPPPSWGLGHAEGLEGLRSRTLRVLGLDAENTALLFTGADMANLAVVKEGFRDLEVYALITAGVSSNALRMGSDEGRYYEPEATRSSPLKNGLCAAQGRAAEFRGSERAKEFVRLAEARALANRGRKSQGGLFRRAGRKGGDPGTINILLLSNARLSPRAMSRAVITATEAKSAALADLDIRSSATPLANPATGTGTDNIIVVQGAGVPIDASGGHTRMGELIARAVYQGVIQAIGRQNAVFRDRPVFDRLRERGIDLFAMSREIAPAGQAGRLMAQVEEVLLDRRYAGFLSALFAVSDAASRGLVPDTGAVVQWCDEVAAEIAGRKEVSPLPAGVGASVPPVLRQGLGALFRGALARLAALPSGQANTPHNLKQSTCDKEPMTCN